MTTKCVMKRLPLKIICYHRFYRKKIFFTLDRLIPKNYDYTLESLKGIRP